MPSRCNSKIARLPFGEVARPRWPALPSSSLKSIRTTTSLGWLSHRPFPPHLEYWGGPGCSDSSPVKHEGSGCAPEGLSCFRSGRARPGARSVRIRQYCSQRSNVRCKCRRQRLIAHFLPRGLRNGAGSRPARRPAGSPAAPFRAPVRRSAEGSHTDSEGGDQNIFGGERVEIPATPRRSRNPVVPSHSNQPLHSEDSRPNDHPAAGPPPAPPGRYWDPTTSRRTRSFGHRA